MDGVQNRRAGRCTARPGWTRGSLTCRIRFFVVRWEKLVRDASGHRIVGRQTFNSYSSILSETFLSDAIVSIKQFMRQVILSLFPDSGMYVSLMTCITGR